MAPILALLWVGLLPDPAASGRPPGVPDIRRVLAFEQPPVGSCAVALTPDGRRLAAGDRRQRITVWDLPSGRVVAAFDGKRPDIGAIAISLDGRMVASAGPARSVALVGLGSYNSREIGAAFIVWDVATGKAIRTIEDDDSMMTPAGLGFSADGRTLFAVVGGDRHLAAWEIASGRRLDTPPDDRGKKVGHTGRVDPDAVFSDDGTRVGAILQLDPDPGGVRVWDTTTFRSRTFPDGPSRRHLAFDDRGGRIVVTEMPRGFAILDATTGVTLTRLETPTRLERRPGNDPYREFPRVFRWDEPRHRIVLGSELGSLTFWDDRDGRCLGERKIEPSTPIRKIHSDGATILVVTGGDTVRIPNQALIGQVPLELWRVTPPSGP